MESTLDFLGYMLSACALRAKAAVAASSAVVRTIVEVDRWWCIVGRWRKKDRAKHCGAYETGLT
jgi:hypothetical protein